MAFTAVRVTVDSAGPDEIARASSEDFGSGLRSVRTSVLVTNQDATNSVYLGGPSVATTDGYELKAGKSIEVVLDGNDILYGICAATITVVLHLLRQT